MNKYYKIFVLYIVAACLIVFSSINNSQANIKRLKPIKQELPAKQDTKSDSVINSEEQSESTTEKTKADLSDYIYKFTGNLSPEVEKNIILQLHSILAENIDASIRFKYTVEALIEKALRGLGYYNYKINILSYNLKVMSIYIDQGPRVTYLNNRVLFTGLGSDEGYFTELKLRIPESGQPLDYKVYNDFVSNINAVAQSYGYFNLRYNIRQIDVDTENNKAQWKIQVDTGNRFKFGKISNNSTNIDQSLVNNVFAFKEGDNFDQYRLTTSAYYLNNLSWFSTISISPTFNYIDGTVDYFADVSAGKRNRSGIIMGYNSSLGFVLKTTYTRFFISKYGDSASVYFDVNKINGSVGINYIVPVKSNPANSNISVDLNRQYHRGSYSKSSSIKNHLSLTYNYIPLFEPNVSLSLISDSYNHFLQKQKRDFDRFTYLKLSSSYTYVDRLRYPNTVVKIFLDYVSNFGLNNKKFSSIESGISLNTKFFDKNRIVLNIRSGKFLKITSKLPSDLLFYSGGLNSVRGYDYQSISPIVNSIAVGGSHKLEASAEYLRRYRDSKIWGAAFVDAGYSANEFSNKNMKYGVGVGVRYELNFGNVSLDFAWPTVNNSKTFIGRYFPSVYLSFNTGI